MHLLLRDELHRLRKRIYDVGDQSCRIRLFPRRLCRRPSPCRYTARGTALSAGNWQSSAPMMPVSASPLPPRARPGLPLLVDISSCRRGKATTVFRALEHHYAALFRRHSGARPRPGQGRGLPPRWRGKLALVRREHRRPFEPGEEAAGPAARAPTARRHRARSALRFRTRASRRYPLRLRCGRSPGPMASTPQRERVRSSAGMALALMTPYSSFSTGMGMASSFLSAATM